MKTIINNLFKIPAVLMLMFMLSVISGIQVSADESNVQEAMGLIDTISEAGQFFTDDLEKPMSRGQFIQAAEALFAIYAGNSNVSFTDVDTGTPLYASLQKAVSLGWISDGDKFRPDDTITLNEAVKICCSVAGYDVKAKYLGGYPTGYVQAANSARILTPDVNGIGEINGKSALLLLWNTLNADKMEGIAYGEFENFYASTTGKTVLAVNYNIYPVEGIMNANAYTSFGITDDTGKKNRVEIDGVAYTASNDAIHDCLGYNVRGYYIENKDDDLHELVYVFPRKNQVLKPNVKYAVYKPENREIIYGEEKTYTAKLSAGFEYVYNGRADYTAGNDILPENGSVTLVDNDDDGIYDVVLVQECYYMEVGKANKYYMTVTDKWDENKMLNFGSGNCIYKITDAEGQEISISDLEEQSILAVYASKDKLLVRAFMCEDSVTGIPQFVYNGDKVIVIGDNMYDVSPEFERLYYDTLGTGIEYEFILGVYGEIVKASSIDGQWFYAYLIDAAVSETLNSQLQMKIFTQYGEHQIVDCADKIQVNGENKKYEAAYNILAPGGTVTAQLIRLKKNSEGKVSAFATATVETSFNPQVEQTEKTIRKYDFGVSNYYYYNNHFYPYFNISGSTVFKIPTDPTNENGYSIGASFNNGNYSGTVMIPYDIDMSGSAGAVVYYSDYSVPAQTSSTPVILIESIKEVMDSDGLVRTCICGWSGGNFVEYYLDDDIEILKNNVAARLESGDIIHVDLQGDTIMSLIVDFIGSTMKPNTGSDVGSFNSTPKVFQYQAGKVYSMQDGYMYLSNKVLEDGSYDFSIGNLINVREPSDYVLYDTETRTIHPADSGYIRTYLSNGEQASYLVIFQSYLTGKYGFIYQSK